jgi:hypothetical protein
MAADVAQSVVSADFNKDGFADIVETRVGSKGGLSYLESNGNGTFQPAVAIGGTGFARGGSVATEDFNNDGVPDLVVYGGRGLGQLGKGGGGTKAVNGGLFVLINNGDGTFQRAISFKNGTINSGGNANGRVTAGDLNGDGNADILVTSNKFGSSANASVVIPPPTSLGTGSTTIGTGGAMAAGGMGGVLGATTTDVFGNTGTTVLGTTGTSTGGTTTPTGGAGATPNQGGSKVTGSANGADVGFLITGNGDGTFNAATRISLA